VLPLNSATSIVRKGSDNGHTMPHGGQILCQLAHQHAIGGRIRLEVGCQE
jgi:hypothetical protein